MTIKTIFHICALVCLIIAGASALTNSQNKLVYFLLFSFFAGAFEVARPFVKLSNSIPSITLQTSKVKRKEKISAGQYNFDVIFNIVNPGNQNMVILKYIIFSTDGKETVKEFSREIEEILPPYASSNKRETASLTNFTSNY